MFSCCCARVDFSWTPVCPCYEGGFNCSQSCLESTLRNDNTSYLRAAQRIAKEIFVEYPRASVWFTGHSLGAGLAALLTASFKGEGRVATLCFESPGERLYASRMGLVESGDIGATLPIFHFFNDGDPIPYGKCSGPLSTCYLAGYAMESVCHLGTKLFFCLFNELRTHYFRFGFYIQVR